MIRLETTTEDDKVRLLETMRKYNEACNFVAEKAFSLKLTNKYKLDLLRNYERKYPYDGQSCSFF